MVSAVVVRSMALLLGDFSSWPCTSGAVSQRFDSITRFTPLISGASVPNISPATPLMAPGIWCASRLASAALMPPMAVCCAGIDEWLGAVSSVRKKVA